VVHADWQGLVTTAIVTASSGYAAWRLMPTAWQRGLAKALGRPAPVPSGCGGGCEGCASARPGSPAQPTKGAAGPGVSVIRIVRRPPAR
jgi:hypothetical protein